MQHTQTAFARRVKSETETNQIRWAGRRSRHKRSNEHGKLTATKTQQIDTQTKPKPPTAKQITEKKTRRLPLESCVLVSEVTAVICSTHTQHACEHIQGKHCPINKTESINVVKQTIQSITTSNQQANKHTKQQTAPGRGCP